MAATPSTGDCDFIFKIIVIGDSGVGKSSLTVRLSEDVFYKDYASTIAIDFRMFFMNFMDKKIRLQIWDTAGQERFQAVATAFYRGANGVMLCFDLTHRPSFTNLEQWMERVRLQALPGIPCVLVGCKSDDAKGGARQVPRDEAVQWAQQHGMGYIETSAKDKDNVIHAFQQIAFSIFEDMKEKNGGHPIATQPAAGQGGNKVSGVNLGQPRNQADKKDKCPC
jgi:small GTP-binding protein